MELNLITLNIIICIVLVVSCWVIWFFVEPDSLKISTKDVVALIATALIILVGFLPFLTPETVSKTDYTSFTITELSDKTTTVTVKEKDGKEKTFKFNGFDEIKDSSFKGFGMGELVYQTSTIDFNKWDEERKNGVEYLFTVKNKEINNFPIINFIKLFVKLDGKNFQPIKTKRFEISEVYSTNPTVKSQYEQK
jgi:hypothetical protein